MRGVGAGGPLPDFVVDLLQARIAGRGLPLRFGGQALARPGGEGGRFVVADVAHRRRRIDRPQPGKAHRGPARITLLPIERRRPALGLDPGPTVGQPELRPLIAAVGHERLPFAVGRQPAGQAERPQQHFVPGPLVVEGEPSALMADRNASALEGNHRPLPRGGTGRRPGRAIGRPEGIHGEQAEDVHQHQFLVLLLVRQTQFDQGAGGGVQVQAQQPRHARVHVLAIGQDLRHRRPRQQPPRRPRMPGAHRLVVGIEQVAEGRVELGVAVQVRLEQEGFPEPGHMGQVPFGGAGVRHRLGALVLGRQGRGQIDRGAAHGRVTLGQGRDRPHRRSGESVFEQRGIVVWRHGFNSPDNRGDHRAHSAHFSPRPFGLLQTGNVCSLSELHESETPIARNRGGLGAFAFPDPLTQREC